MKLENVEVSLNEETFAVNCLLWTADGFRFHVWMHSPETLYKNPRKRSTASRPKTGYFETRQLNANARINKQMIAEASNIAAVQGAVEKAKAALLQKKAVQDEANRISYTKHCKREAAEEMYDALKEIVDTLSPEDFAHWTEKARAAIAKADELKA